MRVANPPTHPTLLYDGQCGFCTRWVERTAARVADRGETVVTRPYQTAAADFPEVDSDAFSDTVHWISTTGAVTTGAGAAFRFLSLAGPTGHLAYSAYRNVPGIARLTEAAYRLVAANRGATSAVARLLWRSSMGPPRFRIAGDLFLRGLGIVFFIAFLSLWVQVEGLIGEGGILPIGQTLPLAQEAFGASRFIRFPTLFWIWANDAAIFLICCAGVLSAVVGIVLPYFWPAWVTAYAAYLSLVVAGQIFTGYQWDALLLEVGFLAIVQTTLFAGRLRLTGAPSPWSFAAAVEPPRAVSWLYRWLLFRLMFSSGVVKLSNNDPTWWNLTALTRHYETQPLPNAIAWYVHQLPEWVHTFSTAGMFAIEIAIPFLFFAPRRPRHLACALTLSFQLLIFATGNYTFFNILTILLCVFLVEDTAWAKRARARFIPQLTRVSPNRMRHLLVPGIILNLALSGVFLSRGALRLNVAQPSTLMAAYSWIAPFRVLNTYGLFAVMTTHRPEIIVQGSNNGVYWQTYEFFHKPGNPIRRPPFVAPHQPRLDWQMWFAALAPIRHSPWFLSFVRRLFEGSKPVKRLMSVDPFPDEPPKFIRARMYDYRFSTPDERAIEGVWWKRTYTHDFLPPVSRP